MKKYRKEWYAKNKKAKNAHSREYYKNNKEQVLLKQGELVRKKYKTDIMFKLCSLLRHRFYNALKNNYGKSKSWEYVGCSPKQLKKHIEAQFKEGMSWKNWSRSGWHIDHIKPIFGFDLSKEEEIKKAFHYTNLQPLWALDNLRKSKTFK